MKMRVAFNLVLVLAARDMGCHFVGDLTPGELVAWSFNQGLEHFPSGITIEQAEYMIKHPDQLFDEEPTK